MKFLIIIFSTIFIQQSFAKNEDYYMMDSFMKDLEYRDLFVEELKKHNIFFVINGNNPNHLYIKTNNDGTLSKLSQIVSSKQSQYHFKDLDAKDSFIKMLQNNNIPYTIRILSNNPPDHRIRIEKEYYEKSKILHDEWIKKL